MRILHVATLVTPDGAYGGPIRVALNQLAELQSRGHDVVLAAGHHGFAPGSVPTAMSGVPVRLFPVRRIVPRSGFAGLTSLPMLRWLRQQAAQTDVAHVHLARDLITLPAARVLSAAQVRYVVQPHGMIDESDHPLARPLDLLWTRRTLEAAETVFHLTATEKASLRVIAGNGDRLRELVNGVPSAPPHPEDSDVPEVLFLARLQQRKRPDTFVEAAAVLAARHPHVRFTLVGPDEGMGAKVSRMIAESGFDEQITWEGALPPERTLQRMSGSAVFVLPSVDEPFPMAVLEALSSGKPVVVTRTCGLAGDIHNAHAGLVVDESVEQLVDAIDYLLSHPAARERSGLNARTLAQQRFSMSSVVDALELAYSSATDSSVART